MNANNNMASGSNKTPNFAGNPGLPRLVPREPLPPKLLPLVPYLIPLAPHEDPDFPAPLTIDIVKQDALEDDSEWEYEYSITETQVFYVTLDLTVPGAQQKRRIVQAPPKSKVKRQVWANPGLNRAKRLVPTPAQTFRVRDRNSAEPSRQEPTPQPDPADTDEDPEEELEVEKPPSIQIMNLEGQNPVVSYDGHIYECAWRKNIGTELLFTSHPPEGSKIPYLRTLNAGSSRADLLAASSVRIQATARKKMKKGTGPLIEPEPEPEPVQRFPPVQFTKKDKQVPGKARINIGLGSSQKRVNQKEFIENIMNLKDEKGEEDMPTVFAKTRPRPFTWLRFQTERRKTERKRLRAIINAAGDQDEEVDEGDDDVRELTKVEAAKAKLVDMDIEDRKMREIEDERMRGRRIAGRNNRNWPRNPLSQEHPLQDEGEMLIGTEEVEESSTGMGKRKRKRAEGDVDEDEDDEFEDDEFDYDDYREYYAEDYEDGDEGGEDGSSVVYEDGLQGYSEEGEGQYEDGFEGMDDGEDDAQMYE